MTPFGMVSPIRVGFAMVLSLIIYAVRKKPTIGYLRRHRRERRKFCARLQAGRDEVFAGDSSRSSAIKSGAAGDVALSILLPINPRPPVLNQCEGLVDRRNRMLFSIRQVYVKRCGPYEFGIDHLSLRALDPR
ncbi:hypothetical protein ASD03_18485 [Ensifer sp. Root127]|nr:hypothetical protein ASD03_18485 [Ensifer sp. Root127]